MKSPKSLLEFVSFFIVYFLMCAFVVTCSMLLFLQWVELDNIQLKAAALYTFINVAFITVIFVVLSTVRRRVTIDRPVKEITNALKKITSGDFSVRLNPRGSSAEFAEIMQSINRMTEELSGVETLRTDFIANVSHELKTPLAVMQNYGTMLTNPNLEERERIDYAKAIIDASHRLSALITNILKLNKLENQQIFPSLSEFDLGEQLCQCLLGFESEWERRNLNIEADIEEDIRIRSDEELLSLVWNNLISNAIKFTPDGGTIGVVLRRSGRMIEVRVSDTGCGMTPEVGAHIFEKFYQGDRSRSSRGNGLGLALVKRVVDVMHGEIAVESVYGKGSTFTVTIRSDDNDGLQKDR